MLAVQRKSLDVIPMKAREFCRNWLGADDSTESVRGYRAECVRLLSRVLKVQGETISSKWGAGLDFPGMPEHYEQTLSYANSLRAIIDAVSNSPELSEMVNDRLNRSHKPVA